MAVLSLLTTIFFLMPPSITSKDFSYYLDSYNDKGQALKRDGAILGSVFLSDYGPLIPRGRQGSIEYQFTKNPEYGIMVWYKNYDAPLYENSILIWGDKSKRYEFHNVFDLFYHPFRLGTLQGSGKWNIRFEGNLSVNSPYSAAYLNDNIRVVTFNPRFSAGFMGGVFLFLLNASLYIGMLWFYKFRKRLPKTDSSGEYQQISPSGKGFGFVLILTITGSLLLKIFPTIAFPAIFILFALFLLLWLVSHRWKIITPRDSICIAVCLVFLFSISMMIFYYRTLEPQLAGDTGWYEDVAGQISSGNFGALFDRPGVYPFFLLTCYKINAWKDRLSVIHWQIFLDFLISLSVFFIFYSITQKWLLSLFLFIISLLHAPFHLWAGWILTENVSGFFFIGAVFWLSLWLKGHKPLYAILSALFLGLLAHTRSVFQFLPVPWLFCLIVYAFYFRWRHKRKDAMKDADAKAAGDALVQLRRICCSIILFLCITVFLIPGWMLRNYFVYNIFTFTGYRAINLLSHFKEILDQTEPENDAERKILDAYREIKITGNIKELSYMRVYERLADKTQLKRAVFDQALTSICSRLARSHFSHYWKSMKEATNYYFGELVPAYSKKYGAFYYSLPLVGHFGEWWEGSLFIHNKIRNIYYLVGIGILGMLLVLKHPDKLAFTMIIWLSLIYLLVVSVVAVISPSDSGRYRMPMELMYVAFPFFVIGLAFEKGIAWSSCLLSRFWEDRSRIKKTSGPDNRKYKKKK